MSIRSRRLFHCRHCGHKMRLGATECGNCYHPTPVFNQISLPLLLAVPVLVIGVVGLLLTAVV